MPLDLQYYNLRQARIIRVLAGIHHISANEAAGLYVRRGFAQRFARRYARAVRSITP